MPPSLRRWVRTCRFSISVLILVAIAAQLNQTVLEQGRPVSNLLSFFTIQSNLIAAIALAWLALRPADGLPSLARDQLRSSAVLYMSITGVVFALLLSGLQEQLQPFRGSTTSCIVSFRCCLWPTGSSTRRVPG